MLRCMPLVACAFMVFATSSLSAAPMVVGYYTDGDFPTTAPASFITQAGHTPSQIANFATATFGSYDMVFLNLSYNGDPNSDVQSRAGDLATYVQNGGRLMIHSRNVTQGSFHDNQLLPSGSGISLNTLYTSDINVFSPPNSLSNGPFGTITDTTLDGGFYSAHGYADLGTIPAGSIPYLYTGTTDQIVAFAYPFGAGFVYYSTIPLDYYLDESINDTPLLAFQNIYTPNVINLLSPGDLQEVPEPASLALWGLGGVVLFAARRWRRRAVC